MQKFVQDNTDKLADADRTLLQERMDALKADLDRNASVDELEKATDALMEAWQQVGARMHQQAGPQTPPDGGPDGPSGDGGEDVVEGEYRQM